MKNLFFFFSLLVTLGVNCQNFQGWNRKQPITINSSQIPGNQSLIDFPFLVTLDYLDTEIVDAGTNSALNGGGDIRFSLDAEGNNRLAIEIVEFVTSSNSSGRKCQIWVKIPSLSATIDTTIYIWYNKSGETQPASNSTYGRESVWSNSYVAVWHMDEFISSGGAPIQIFDSSSNTNDGNSGTNMNTNNDAASKIGDGKDLLGNNFFNVGNDASLNLTSNFTVSGWFNPETFHAFYLMAKRHETVSSGYNIYPQSDGFLGYYDGATSHSTGLGYNLNDWNYAVIKLDASGTGMTAFLNGSFSSQVTTQLLPDGTGQNLYLGCRSNGANNLLDGMLDEIRVSNVERSNEWIETEFNNQNTPSTFASAGVPEVSTNNETPSAVNLIDSSGWTEGTGGASGFSTIYADEVNIREIGTTPYGTQGVIWKNVYDETIDKSGGWITDYIGIDHTKTYRFTTWVKQKNTLDGWHYMAFFCKDDLDNNTGLRLNESINGNPYVFNTSLPNTDQWYLVVGFIHNSGYTQGTHINIGGVYDTNGVKQLNTTDYKFSSTATRFRLRNYLSHTTDANIEFETYGPTMYEVNGQEPTIQELVSNAQSNSNTGNNQVVSGYWSLDNQDIYYSTGNVGIGTDAPDELLAVNGTIHSKEVKVDLNNWPDYVFTKGYNLPTLKQIAEYIKHKGHLPNIPSAKEVEENGMLIGQMNTKLLEKIEELTLYILQQQKQIESQKSTIDKILEKLKTE